VMTTSSIFQPEYTTDPSVGPMPQRRYTVGLPLTNPGSEYDTNVHCVSWNNPPACDHTVVHVNPFVLTSISAWSKLTLSTPNQRRKLRLMFV